MNRSTLRLMVLAVGVLVADSADAAAQQSVAPFYALPAAGTWAEYSFTQRDAAGKEKAGTLRISHVGVEEIKRRPHAWIETKLLVDGNAPDDWRIHKVLVDAEQFRQTGDLARCVVEAYRQIGPNAATLPIRAEPLASFLFMGMRPSTALEKQGEPADQETPAGKWRCQQMQARSQVGEKALTYTAWLCAEAPFGLCQFSMVLEPEKPATKTEFRAVLSGRGTMAQSEVKRPLK